MYKEDQILELLYKMDKCLENVEEGQNTLEKGQQKLQEGQQKLEKDIKYIKEIQGTLKTDINVLSKNQDDLKADLNRRFNYLDISLNHELSKVKDDIKELQRV